MFCIFVPFLWDMENTQSLSSYIYKILKQVHPTVGIANMAMTVVNSFVVDVFRRISKDAVQLSGEKVTEYEIENAVEAIIQGELKSQSLSQGNQALRNFNNANPEIKNDTEKAGLQFSVGKTKKMMKEETDKQVAISASVFLAAVLEFLLSRLLQQAGNASLESGNARITPRHVQVAFFNDGEFKQLFNDIQEPQAQRVIPNIHPSLLQNG